MGLKRDFSSGSLIVVTDSHHEVHEGDHYNLSYSVADIGVMATPADVISLSFTTPNTTKLLHMIISAICSSGAQLQFIEGKTGGGATPTGVIASNNSHRGSSNTSTILDVAGGNVGSVSYDATVFTGGTSLVDEYIGADGLGNSFAAGDSRSEQEWVLAANTLYQVSLTEAGNVPATLQLAWYEHISRVPL